MDRSVCTLIFSLLSAITVRSDSTRVHGSGATGDTGSFVQGPTASSRLRVEGLAYDSLRGTPLASATISVTGNGVAVLQAVSDSTGHFHLDSLSSGTYAITLRHESLDSVGMPELSTQAVVSDGRDTIRIATPSFSTLWTRHCARAEPAGDSGLVFGVVRHAHTAAPIAGAYVVLRWLEIGVTPAHKLKQKYWSTDARTDSAGTYALCGVPSDVGVRVASATDSLSSGLVDLLPQERRIRRRDLFVGPVPTRETRAPGKIHGTVLDENGIHLSNARVSMEEGLELRTDEDGHFVITDVPLGTRQIEVSSIGLVPGAFIVNVTSDDTTRVEFTLRKITSLRAMRIIASLAQTRRVLDFESRRTSGIGYIKDTTTIGRIGTLQDVIAGFPSTQVKAERSGRFYVSFPKGSTFCTGSLWVDGRLAEFDELHDVRLSDVAGIEVYPRWMEVPPKFLKVATECGVVIVWTKWFFAMARE